MARTRTEYLLTFGVGGGRSLDTARHPDLHSTREPSRQDTQGLADLMLDSYQGTIDYDGETIAEAIKEVDSYFTRPDSPPLLHLSTMGVFDNRIVSAFLVSKWEKRKEPLVSYIMTEARLKGRGIAGSLGMISVEKVRLAGHSGMRAMVTDGNGPSEKLMKRLGFKPLTIP